VTFSVAPAAEAGPVNVASTDPLTLRRTTVRAGVPEPVERPTRILPSPCSASALTEAPTSGEKVASSEASVL